MKTQAKKVATQSRENIMQDQLRVYSKLFSLVEQALHARIVSDAMWRYRWERVGRTRAGNSVISFSQVALENFAVQQLWKMFDRKNSVFHVWYVAECLPHPSLLKWVDDNVARIQKDVKLINEWRHVVVAHRGEVSHYASGEYDKKFTEGRASEKRMQDFLLDFLCQIKFEMQGIPVKKTMEGLKGGLTGFGEFIRNQMTETFKDL
jgi:hypothetical protein